MRISVPMMQNLGLSGFPVVGSDIGGYKGSPQPDLLTKWLELGAFNPIDRDHTEKGTADQEPWVHGPEHEAIRKRYIEERYRLLPYIYTGMEETTRDGLPLMRPMFLEYPEQEPLVTEGDWANSQYFFGHDLLVAPEPYEIAQEYRTMLPAGNLWYDYWTGKQLQPGTIKVKPALDTLHVYVRGGAIIPRQPLVQTTAEKPQGPLDLRVYPDRSCQGFTTGRHRWAPTAFGGSGSAAACADRSTATAEAEEGRASRILRADRTGLFRMVQVSGGG
jgi:alpha-glucosidase